MHYRVSGENQAKNYKGLTVGWYKVLGFLYLCKVMIYNYVLYWFYSMTKSVVIALIYLLVFCGILLYWV